jgi:hypothetical protein
VVLFSYVYAKGGQSSLRELTAKLDSFAGAAARFIPSADGEWVTQTSDITLVDSAGTPGPRKKRSPRLRPRQPRRREASNR